MAEFFLVVLWSAVPSLADPGISAEFLLRRRLMAGAVPCLVLGRPAVCLGGNKSIIKAELARELSARALSDLGATPVSQVAHDIRCPPYPAVCEDEEKHSSLSNERRDHVFQFF